MNYNPAPRMEGLIALLHRLAQPRDAGERCEFCNVPISPAHRHLLEVGKRKIICACDPCAMRFQATVAGRFKLIPRDVRVLPDFQMTEYQWDGFALPINLAFLYRDTTEEKVIAMYPSPAGATESLLPAENWRALEDENPALKEMEPDVEALLVNRIGAAREYFIAPIDKCYEITGRIRMHWRGLSGGEEVWAEVNEFFAALRENAVAPIAKSMEVLHA